MSWGSQGAPDGARGGTPEGARGGTPGTPGPLAGALSRRLRYLGAARASEGGEGVPGAGGLRRGAVRGAPVLGPERIAALLEGFERIGELTWRRVVRREDPGAGREVSPLLLPEGYSPREVLFFDSETTGLSGGAGSYVFLFGSARFEAGELVCEQLFLGDFPGEPEFLRAVARRLEGHRLFLSYNGRAFDAPLLKTRFVLNRMPFALERQEDLLYWARRLWRRSLPDCSLPTIERRILGVERERDVPGWEVPGIYLGFLAGSEEERLPLVMEHNLQDVVSLAGLYGQVNRLLLDCEVPEGTDGTALGCALLRAGQRRGEALLQELLRAGDLRAGRALSLHYKRQGRWRRASALWEAMTGEHSAFAAVELAKLHEHRLGDPPGALQWVHRILSWNLPLSAEERAQLVRRRRRLERKCAARGGLSGGALSPGNS